MRIRPFVTVAAAAVSLFALVGTASAHGKHGEKANFPMPAAEFQKRVDARAAKAKEHVEARAAKLPEAEAKALRAKFAERQAKVAAEVKKAVADGTVTKDEAKAVRQAAGHGGHRGHAKGGGKDA